jgi:hypothetical protein
VHISVAHVDRRRLFCFFTLASFRYRKNMAMTRARVFSNVVLLPAFSLVEESSMELARVLFCLDNAVASSIAVPLAVEYGALFLAVFAPLHQHETDMISLLLSGR